MKAIIPFQNAEAASLLHWPKAQAEAEELLGFHFLPIQSLMLQVEC